MVQTAYLGSTAFSNITVGSTTVSAVYVGSTKIWEAGSSWTNPDIANASYDSKTYSTTSQDTVPSDLFFKSDGAKVYTLGQANDRVYQHSLSTAWDISTASYDNVSFSFSGQVGSGNGPMSLHFKPDGTKMYIVDTGSSSGNVSSADGFISQYSLSTAWDLSTASYDSVSATVAVANNSGSTFSRDGTKFYVIGMNASNQARTLQYNLSTAWDLSTVSFSNNEFNHTSQDGSMVAIHINPDGDKMWMVGYDNDKVYQYSLSTDFDVSTASYDSVQFSLGSQTSVPYGFTFKDDGSKMYTIGLVNDGIFQYST